MKNTTLTIIFILIVLITTKMIWDMPFYKTPSEKMGNILKIYAIGIAILGSIYYYSKSSGPGYEEFGSGAFTTPDTRSQSRQEMLQRDKRTQYLAPRSTPYTQSIMIPDRPIEETYDKVSLWLVQNSCILMERNPPIYIGAKYSTLLPRIWLGPRDDHPKIIDVHLTPIRDNTLLDFTFTQIDDIIETSGRVFWGSKLVELYEQLGANIPYNMYSELLPEELMHNAINRRKQIITVFSLVSFPFLLYSWDRSQEMALTIFSLLLAPLGVLAFLDLQKFRKLLRKAEHV